MHCLSFNLCRHPHTQYRLTNQAYQAAGSGREKEDPDVLIFIEGIDVGLPILVWHGSIQTRSFEFLKKEINIQKSAIYVITYG